MIGAILPISLSGMTGAGRRLAVSAENVANLGTVDPATGVAPVAKRITSKAIEPTGGVATEVDNDSRGPAVFGEILGAEIDPAAEIVSQQIASYDFRANAKALKTADAMERSLLDILA